MIITLVGYRGTGKSSVAVGLAARLGMTPIDADALIERRAGCTIRELFEQQGEPAFRRLERAVLAELLAQDGLVIAAGGGAVLDPDTRQRMRAAGPVVWLQASAATIAARLEADRTTRDRRPPLTSVGPRHEIELLLAQREPLYREVASLAVPTDARDVPEVVDDIVARLPGRELSA